MSKVERMGYNEEAIESLVNRFNSQTLPKNEWTHEAHIIVAFWYSSRYTDAEALIKVRNAIQNYNTAVGTINSDSSGYHETLTVFWLSLVRKYLSGKNGRIEAFVNNFIAEGNADKELPLKFYTREILFSMQARKNWVAPDKISMDAIVESPTKYA